jgi:hypothetical protein
MVVLNVSLNRLWSTSGTLKEIAYHIDTVMSFLHGNIVFFLNC